MTFEEWLQSDGLNLFRGSHYKGHFETGLKEAIEAAWDAAYAAGHDQGYRDYETKLTNAESTKDQS